MAKKKHAELLTVGTQPTRYIAIGTHLGEKSSDECYKSRCNSVKLKSTLTLAFCSRPEVANDVISGTAIEEVGPDVSENVSFVIVGETHLHFVADDA